MKRTSGKDASRKSEPEFAALGGFFSAYLHQDFRDEYGSAVAAAAAFSNDAEPQQIRAVVEEWKTWRAQLVNSSPAEAAAAIRALGGAWQPETLAGLDELGRALEAGKSRRKS